jgi:hypothetical protein
MTREANIRPSLQARAAYAKKLGCDTFLSLHSNYPSKGVIIYYSFKRPEDKAIAINLGQAIANALGIDFNGAVTKVENGEDFYGTLRYGVRQGLKHVLLIEHGAHEELAIDTQSKLQKITNVYKTFFNLQKEDDGMLVVIPYGVPDYGPAQTYASQKRGAVLDWGLVTPNDDVVQIGGPVAAVAQVPCKSFLVISGASRQETAHNVDIELQK